MQPSEHVWVLLAVVAVLVGVSKTGLPGIGILSVVLTVTAFGHDQTRQANGTLLLLLLTGDVFAVAWYRRHADWRYLVRLLPPAAIGIVLAYVAVKCFAHPQMDRYLARVIGGIVLTLLGLNRWWTARQNQRAAAQAEPGLPSHWLFAVTIGGLAGITTMLSNAAGPLIIIYLLAARLDKHAFLGTAGWYFLLLNSFKVPFMAELKWITWQTLAADLRMAPMVVVGALLGLVIVKYIPQKGFRGAVELLAAAGAIKLLIG